MKTWEQRWHLDPDECFSACCFKDHLVKKPWEHKLHGKGKASRRLGCWQNTCCLSALTPGKPWEQIKHWNLDCRSELMKLKLFPADVCEWEYGVLKLVFNVFNKLVSCDRPPLKLAGKLFEKVCWLLELFDERSGFFIFNKALLLPSEVNHSVDLNVKKRTL